MSELVIVVEELGRAVTPGPFVPTVIVPPLPVMSARTAWSDQGLLEIRPLLRPTIAQSRLRHRRSGAPRPGRIPPKTRLPFGGQTPSLFQVSGCMSMVKKVIPRCLGWSGSVRANSIPKSAVSALEFQTFCPLTTHSLPSPSARVPTLARSEPEPGPLKSRHHESFP